MSGIRTKIIYVVLPLLMLVGVTIIIGSTGPGDSSRMKDLAKDVTLVSLNPPDAVNFAGELVPLQDFEVKERLDKEMMWYIFHHSATILNLKRANRWEGTIMKILKENHIPEDFFFLAIAESHLTNSVSSAGARGFWQFMPETAKGYGLRINEQVDERYDPVKSTHAACKYIKDAYSNLKNWTLVAASYNMGVGGVQNQMNKQQVGNYYDLFLNAETAAYVFRVLAIKSIHQNPEKYGFKLDDDQLYQPLKVKYVKVTESITNLVQFAKDHGTTYKMIKVLNPWMLKDELTVEKGESYVVSIPYDVSYEPIVNELVADSIPLLDSLQPGTPDSANKTDNEKKLEETSAEEK